MSRWLWLFPLQVPGGGGNSQSLLDGKHLPSQCLPLPQQHHLLPPCLQLLPQQGLVLLRGHPGAPGVPSGPCCAGWRAAGSYPSVRSAAACLVDMVPSAASQTLGYLHMSRASTLSRHLHLTIKLQIVPLLAP